MKRTVKYLHILGGVCLFLYALLLFYAAVQRPKADNAKQAASPSDLTIQWDTDPLVYDGTSGLNLMEGVEVTGPQGQDLTAQTSGVIQSTDDLGRKYIVYTVTGWDGTESNQPRGLVLQNYKGPNLWVSSQLLFSAAQLDDLTGYLTEEGKLTADNGYGRNSTDQVTWYREKVGQGEYQITFSLVNEFYDVVTAQSYAYISDVENDIELELVADQITLHMGSFFEPSEMILRALDENGVDQTQKVDIQGTVDDKVPGNYTLRYTLTSSDGRQRATRELRVTISES